MAGEDSTASFRVMIGDHFGIDRLRTMVLATKGRHLYTSVTHDW